MAGSSYSITTALEKARMSSETAFLPLLDIDVLDPTTGLLVETLHLVCNTENITYLGVTYIATKFDLTFSQEGNAAPQLSLQVVDYTQALQAYMQLYAGGVGFPVTLTIINSAALSAPPELEEFFEVVSATAKDFVATFRLGATNEVGQVFPRRRQTREFCHARYKDPYTCGYGQIYMTPLGIQNPETITIPPRLSQLVPSGDTPKTTSFVLSAYVTPLQIGRNFTLQVYNKTAGATIVTGTFSMNADQSLSTSGTANIGWSRINGDIYRIWIWSTSGIPAGAVDIQVVIKPCNYSSGVTYKDILPFGCAQLEFGVITPSNYQHVPGSTPGAVNKLRYSNDFTQTRWRDTGGTGYYRVEIKALSQKYPAINQGALDTCDLTLQGPNGCAAHNNTINFHGYPGLNNSLFSYA